MKRRMLLFIFIILLSLGCSLISDLTGGESVLEEAMAYVPKKSKAVYFTDWTKTKEYLNAGDLNSSSNKDDQIDFMLEIGKDIPALSFSNAQYFITTLDSSDPYWIGNTLDFEWEFSLYSYDFAPAFVYKVNAGYDLDALMQIFGDEGFSSVEEDGVQFFSNELKPDYLRSFIRPEMAVIVSERVIITSSSDEAVELIADTYLEKRSSWLDDEDYQIIVDHFSDASTVIFYEDMCKTANEVMIDRLEENYIDALLDDLDEQPLEYDSFAAGYTQDNDGNPVFQMVFSYGDSETAEQDLDTRMDLIENGKSLIQGRLYSEIFDEYAFEQVDHLLILTIEFPDDFFGGHYFMSMCTFPDLLFGICSE